MDRIALHIEYLLLRHECVVIPDFGAFIKVRHSAYADAQTGVLHPMTSEIRFNGVLTHDDGLLASSFARKYKISYSEGREMLRISTAQLRDALSYDGEVTLGRLGVLSMSEDGKPTFSPLQNFTSLASQLGYYPVSERPKIAEFNPMPKEKTQEEKPLHSDSDAITTPKRARLFDTSKYYYIRINKRLAHVAASLLAVIAIGVSAYMPVKRYFAVDQASVIPVDTMIEAATRGADSAANIFGGNNQVSSSAKIETSTSTESVAEAADRAKDKEWHLIVATFRTEKEAENFIEANKEKGYQLADISSKTLHRVSALSSDDKDTLLSQLNDKEFQIQFPQSWIYQRPQ